MAAVLTQRLLTEWEEFRARQASVRRGERGWRSRVVYLFRVKVIAGSKDTLVWEQDGSRRRHTRRDD